VLHAPALMSQSLCMCTDISLPDSTLDFIGLIASFSTVCWYGISYCPAKYVHKFYFSPLVDCTGGSATLPHTLLYLSVCNKLLQLLYFVIL